MKRVNVIIVIHESGEQLLFCKRTKNPYINLYNMVGGKVLPDEDSFEGAYRELYEETNIKREDIDLIFLMKTEYIIDHICLEVFYGQLKHPVELKEEVNPLLWLGWDCNFYDQSLFAGEGNIGHFLEHVKMHIQK